MHRLIADVVRTCGAVAVALIVAILVSLGDARALTCAELIIQRTAQCMGGDLNKAAACRTKAEAQGCSAASSTGAGNSCDNDRVREAVAWVFRDAGARANYTRRRSAGTAPVDAVIAAQGHNPAEQAMLKQCRDFVAWYIRDFDNSGGGGSQPPPQQPPIGCSCVSIVPAGGLMYRVTNSCAQSMQISVLFVDVNNLNRSDYPSVGTVGYGQSVMVRAPAYPIISIEAATLQAGGSRLVCDF